MAFTLVSKISAAPSSRSWVSQRVHLLEPSRLYPSVCLRRGDSCVAKQLLNCPQIGTSFEQMGGERVSQRMRRHTPLYSRAPHPAVKPTTHVRGRQALAGLRDEERRLAFLLQRGAPALEIARDRPPCRFP